MKKLMLLLLVVLISSSAFANEVLDELKKQWFYPSEYYIQSDYNPDKTRDWQFGEVTNGFKWKADKGKKLSCFMPDEYWISWDYNPNNERNWQCQEITTGVKWNLK